MRIVIVGLGVIGGGYAMALKEAGYSEFYGVDKNIETLKKAKALGIIKEGYEDGKDIIQSADLIVLAIYPNLVKDFIIKNKEYFKIWHFKYYNRRANRRHYRRNLYHFVLYCFLCPGKGRHTY